MNGPVDSLHEHGGALWMGGDRRVQRIDAVKQLESGSRPLAALVLGGEEDEVSARSFNTAYTLFVLADGRCAAAASRCASAHVCARATQACRGRH